MFRVTKIDKSNKSFYKHLMFDISMNHIFYTSKEDVCHVLSCDFSKIYNDIHNIVKTDDFQNECLKKSFSDDYYEFEYNFNDNKKLYSGSIEGLINHNKLVRLIESCAEKHLDDEKRLLENSYGKGDDGLLEQWAKDIIISRQKLNEDFLDFWVDITY